MPLEATVPELNAKWIAHGLFGVPTLKADEALNDSDKTFTVTTDRVWEIQSIWVELTTTATATVRQLVVQLQDSASDVIAEVIPGITQDASLTNNYLFAPDLPDLTALRDSINLTTPFPKIWLAEGMIVRIYDNNAVDAAADDMVVQMMVREAYMIE